MSYGSPKKLRVATLVAYPGTFGGAERLAGEISRGLDPERFERIHCVTRWPEAGSSDDADAREWAASLEDDGVEVILLERSGRADLRSWAPLIRLLRGGSIDVIHSHMFGANVTGVSLGRAFRVPVVVAHEHSWSFSGGFVRPALDRYLIGRGSDMFLAVSREDARRMVEVEGIPERHITHVPNGIPDLPPGTVPIDREELGVAPDDFVVVSVGVLRPEKRFDLLIDAAARLREQMPRLKVLIVGPRADRNDVSADLEDLIAERGLEDRVQLMGARLDVERILPAADLGACISSREGSPLTVIEYMRAGLPVVGSAVGGIPDLVDAPKGGRLFTPGDSAALAEHIAALEGDQESRQAMGRHNLERQRAEFRLVGTIARIEEIYERLYPRRGR